MRVGDERRRRAPPCRSRPARRAATPALTSAAIIRPFQSASTLSSRPGPDALARAPASSMRAQRRRAAVSSSVACAASALSRLRMLWPSKLPSGGHVVMLREECGIVGAQDLTDLGQRPDVELALLAFGIGIERGRRTRPPAWSSRARASRRSRARALRIERLAGARMREREQLRAAARCRRASSRNAAPASARRPNSARSRRRDGRRCRPRRCGRASARRGRRSAAGRRCAGRRATDSSNIEACGNFGAPRDAAVDRVDQRRAMPPRDVVELGAAPIDDRALPAARVCGQPLHQRLAVLLDPVRLLAEQARDLAQHIDEGRPAVARGLSGNRCRPRPARRPDVRNMVSGQPPCSPSRCSADM